VSDPVISISVGDPEFEIWVSDPTISLVAEAVGERGPRGFAGPSLSGELGTTPEALLESEVTIPVAEALAGVDATVALKVAEIDGKLDQADATIDQTQAAGQGAIAATSDATAAAAGLLSMVNSFADLLAPGTILNASLPTSTILLGDML
jgi:hypothetical protein